LTYAEIDSLSVAKLNRTVQLNDGVLRHLAIKIDPRLVDTMVALAKGETVADEEGETAESKAAPAAAAAN